MSWRGRNNAHLLALLKRSYRPPSRPNDLRSKRHEQGRSWQESKKRSLYVIILYIKPPILSHPIPVHLIEELLSCLKILRRVFAARNQNSLLQIQDHRSLFVKKQKKNEGEQTSPVRRKDTASERVTMLGTKGAATSKVRYCRKERMARRENVPEAKRESGPRPAASRQLAPKCSNNRRSRGGMVLLQPTPPI